MAQKNSSSKILIGPYSPRFLRPDHMLRGTLESVEVLEGRVLLISVSGRRRIVDDELKDQLIGLQGQKVEILRIIDANHRSFYSAMAIEPSGSGARNVAQRSKGRKSGGDLNASFQ